MGIFYEEFYPNLSDNRKKLFDSVSSMVDYVFPDAYQKEHNIKLLWRNHSYTFIWAELIMEVDEKFGFSLAVVGEEKFTTYYRDMKSALAKYPDLWHTGLFGGYDFDVHFSSDFNEDDEESKKYLRGVGEMLVVVRIWVNNWKKITSKIEAMDNALNSSLDKKYRTEFNAIKKFHRSQINT